KESNYLKNIAFVMIITNQIDKKCILHCIIQSDAISFSVTNEEIRNSMRQALKDEGLLLEPSSAATIAALPHLYSERMIDRSDEVVLIATGSGLKTLEQL